MKHPKHISIQDFTYDLPAEKIAAYPLEKRDESKLLVYKNGEIKEDVFKHIASFIKENSVLVFNTTKVINARLNFLNEKKQSIEIFCLEPGGQDLELAQAMAARRTIRWNCLVGNLKRWREGDLILSKDGVTLFARLVERKELYVVVEFYWEPAVLAFSEILETMGHTPIPPYLKRESEETDQERYQTIYAQAEGSVAAPTAGLHFTEPVLEKLKAKHVHSLAITLHVGAGTFKPVKSESMLGHDMHSEWIEISRETLEQLSRYQDKDTIAVGTTSLRTLESLYWMGVKAMLYKDANLHDLEIKQWEVYDLDDKKISPAQSLETLLAWMDRQNLTKLVCRTQILIAPPYELKMAKGIITNFHQPQSTLLLLISAVVGDKWREIYSYALAHDFRFLSYGDSSLLLK